MIFVIIFSDRTTYPHIREGEVPFQFDTLGVLVAIVETMLPRNSPRNTVLVMNLEAEVSSADGRKRVLENIQIFFHRPGNYTKVLWTKKPLPAFGRDKEVKCLLRSNHDSCWRSDGVEAPLNDLLREMCKGIKDAKGKVEYQIKFTSQFGYQGFQVKEVLEVSQEVSGNEFDWIVKFP